MSLVEDKQVIEALSSTDFIDLSEMAFPRGALNGVYLLNAGTPQAAIENRAIATVTIVNQEPRW